MNSHNICPVFDGHNDTLMAFFLPKHGKRQFTQPSNSGHIDLVRALEGGLGAGFFAIFVPHQESLRGKGLPQPGDPAFRPIDALYAEDTVRRAVAAFRQMEKEAGGRFAGIRTLEELNSRKDALRGILHLEGAEPVHENLDNLEELYTLGIRSIGLVWSRENAFGHGVNFCFPGSPVGPGLKAAGKALVRACNRMGIMVDLSHLTEKGFWDVAELSDAPLVATHSCVHALCPSPRNLTDEQIDAVGESQGIIGINFCTAFLRPDGERGSNTPISLIVDHIKYVADRIGVDHVGLGSDFDGAYIPEALGDVTGLPKLIGELETAGFTRDEVQKIAFDNWVRVLGATWKN